MIYKLEMLRFNMFDRFEMRRANEEEVKRILAKFEGEDKDLLQILEVSDSAMILRDEDEDSRNK